MGIDIHNLNFLSHAADLGARFGATLGIGRQAVYVDDWMLERHRAARGLPPLQTSRAAAAGPGGVAVVAGGAGIVGAAGAAGATGADGAAAATGAYGAAPMYFEPLLQQWFGAAVVDAVDASPYEAARLIHDMNLPWPVEGPLAAELGRYDAVLDFGCLEHVFNFPVAWRNCVDLCRVGGHLLHALPANNLSGHGFYQFSPELFFNLYRPERGFALQALYLALKADPSRWWQVANPRDLGRRVNLCNGHEVYLLVLAQKLRATEPALAPPQQSDYAEQTWQSSTATRPAGDARSSRPGRRQAVAARLADLGLIDIARSLRERMRAIGRSGFSLPAPDYRRLDVDSLIRRARVGAG